MHSKYAQQTVIDSASVSERGRESTIEKQTLINVQLSFPKLCRQSMVCSLTYRTVSITFNHKSF